MTALVCRHCGSNEHLAFDYESMVSVQVQGGKVTTVEAGGVFGGLPASMLCHTCGGESTVDQDLAEAVYQLVKQETGFDDDGWVLFRAEDHGHENMYASATLKDADDRPLYYHRTSGWVHFEHAEVFPSTNQLVPVDGHWVDTCHPDTT